MEAEEPDNYDHSSAGGVVELIIVIGLCWWGYNNFIKHDYSIPWWSGVETQEVCDAFDGSKCYILSVESDGTYVDKIYFPNGGYVIPASSSCAERAGGGRFCTFSEPNGKEWDIFPLQQ